MAPAHVPVVISGIEFAFTALLAALGLWNLASLNRSDDGDAFVARHRWTYWCVYVAHVVFGIVPGCVVIALGWHAATICSSIFWNLSAAVSYPLVWPLQKLG